MIYRYLQSVGEFDVIEIQVTPASYFFVHSYQIDVFVVVAPDVPTLTYPFAVKRRLFVW